MSEIMHIFYFQCDEINEMFAIIYIGHSLLCSLNIGMAFI